MVGETALLSNWVLVALRRPQQNCSGKKTETGNKLRRREHLIPTAEQGKEQRGEGRWGRGWAEKFTSC